MNGLEFDEAPGQSVLHKFSPDLSKTASRDDVQASSALIGSSSDIEAIAATVDLPMTAGDKAGRLTGRATSWKEQQLSKSLADTCIDNFKEGNKADDGLAARSAQSVSLEKKDSARSDDKAN